MKKIFMLGIAAALVLVAGSLQAELPVLQLANPVVIMTPLVLGAPFSSNVNDYSLLIAKDGSKIRQVFYGKFIEAVDDAKLADITLYGLFVKDGIVMDDGSGGKAEFEMEMEYCEKFPSAGSNAFRCIGKEVDLGNADVEDAVQELIGFYSHDLFNFQFRMGTVSSAYLWGRHFYFNVSGASEISDSDEDGVPDESDNCNNFLNTGQLDTDEDGVGDACDICIEDSDPDQIDFDHDGIGDACDPCPYDNSNECGVDTEDDEDDDEDLNASDETEDLGAWLSNTDDESSDETSSVDSAAGGCSMMPVQPMGCAAFIMLALALLPIALNRRK